MHIHNKDIFIRMETIAERLKRLMREKRLSYRKLAKLVHRNHMTVYGWATGGKINDTDMERLARVFGMTVDELKYGPDGPPPPEIDGGLLTEILRTVGEESDALGITLSADKMSDAITTLYQLFIRQRHVDRTVVRRIVRLAA